MSAGGESGHLWGPAVTIYLEGVPKRKRVSAARSRGSELSRTQLGRYFKALELADRHDIQGTMSDDEWNALPKHEIGADIGVTRTLVETAGRHLAAARTPQWPPALEAQPAVDEQAGTPHEHALLRAAHRLPGSWALVQPPHLLTLALQQREASEGRLVPPDPEPPWDADPALGWLRQHTGSSHTLWQAWDRFADAQAAYHRSALDALQQMRTDMTPAGLPFTPGFDGPSQLTHPGCGLGFFVDVVLWLAGTHRGVGPAQQPLLAEDGTLGGRHVATAPIAPKVVGAVNALLASWLTTPSTMALLDAWDAAEARRRDLDAAAQGLRVAELSHGDCAACSNDARGP